MLEIKVACSAGISYKLKYVLPNDPLMQLYHSLVHSNFIYGLTVWGNTFPSYISAVNYIDC